ncbi:MAG: EF-hand domain-containing protein [Proteobacteria bacterium]|nr:EF-hand domain-containing protein [Pseudomonadota bacterium]MBS0463405.1 EF-hand domain-containing protein [Pseudomonadota bacterium]
MTRFRSARHLLPLALIALAVALPSGAAVAQGAGKAPTTAAGKAPAFFWIGDLDVNHDGKISRQEAAAMPEIAKSFDAIDTNHDGFITMSEVKAMWRARLQAEAQRSVQARMAAFAKADTQHQGKITLEQAKAAGMAVVVNNFAAFDANHDGFVDQKEMRDGAIALANAMLNARAKRMVALFEKADTNHDGKLTRAEFTAAFPRFAPAFAFFDENHDGFVTLAEFALPPGF